ncbi:hypothetical protein Tco_1511991 [Tanacetum coccineum]
MSTSHMSISSYLDDESIGSSVSYLFEAPPSPDYAPTLDADTDPLEAPALPNYTPRSDIESEPSEDDLKESKEEPSEEDSSEEDPMEDDEPLPAQTVSTLPAIVSHIIRPGEQISLCSLYRLHPYEPLMIPTPRKMVWAPFTLPYPLRWLSPRR